MMDADMQNCVIYARYSSHAQKDTSIEDQVRDIEVYCKLNNLNIVKVYADRHLTGTSDKRPQFQQMMQDAARGRWQYVVVWKTDRFARNRYDSATYKYRLKRHGVRVLSAKESIPDGPEGILLEAVLEGSAEYYSANLAQNIKRGMRANALQCKVNNGSLPYGYCKGPDGRYAIVPAEAEIVKEIYRKAAGGALFVDICRDLNARRILTKRGTPWRKSSFEKILKNEIYRGVYHYADIRIEGGVPRIIDDALFAEVARKMKSKANAHRRRRKDSEYMLTGKLFCGECGSTMIGVSGTSRNGDTHYYYSCSKRRTEHSCNKRSVAREQIEQLVVNAALDAVLQDDVIAWIADQVMRYQDREGKSAQLEALREELKAKEKAISNMLDAIEAGIITASTKQRLHDLEEQRRQLKSDLAVEEAATTHIERDFIVYWLERFRDGDRNDKDFRRKVIDTFVSAVYLYDDHVRIAFNYTSTQNIVEKEIIDKKFVDGAEDAAGANGSYKLAYAPPNATRTNHPTVIFFLGSVFVLSMSIPTEF